MTGYTLDTNIVTAHLKRNPLVRQRIRQAVVAGHSVMLNADLLMAAIALVNDVVLVTHNTAHLSRVADLQLEDWLLP